MSRTIFKAKKNISLAPEPIEVGGTGNSVIGDAVTSLGLITNEYKDAATGIATLGADLKVKPENLPTVNATGDTLEGNFANVFPNTTLEFQITNYDSERPYALTDVLGQATLKTRDDLIADAVALGANRNFNDIAPPPGSSFASCKSPGTILYTAPGIAGPGGFTLNGKLFSLNVIAPFIDAPIILTPTNNDIITLPETTITFNRPAIHGTTEEATFFEYELAEDAGFTLNVYNSGILSYPGTDVILNIIGLITNKLYYLRVKAGNSSIWSNWSTVVSFATDIIPGLLERQILSDSDPGYAAARFGISVSMSGDAETIAVGVPQKSVGLSSIYGSVFLFAKQIDNSYLEIASVDPNPTAQFISSQFGYHTCLSRDKNYLLATAPLMSDTLQSQGGAYLYKCGTPGDPTSFALLESLIEETPTMYGGYGNYAAMSDTSPIFRFALSGNNEIIDIYRLETDIVNHEIALTAPDLALNPNSGFGRSMAFNAAGTRLVIGSNEAYVDLDGLSNPIRCGVVYIYNLVSNVWELGHTLWPADTSIDAQFFGNTVGITPDGNTIFVGDDYENPDNFIYVFNFNSGNNTWDLVQTLQPSLWATHGGILSSVSFSQDGLTAIIGSDSESADTGSWSGAGRAYVFKYANSTWTQEQVLEASDKANSSEFGYVLDTNDTADKVVIGSFTKTMNGLIQQGCAYIFR